MNEVPESERKRQHSLKLKKELFKAKELAVQHALKNLDNKSNKNRIVFDEDVDKFDELEIIKVRKKRRHNLFDDNVDDDDKDDSETIWDINNLENKKKENMILGNDVRFKIDDRFVDDNHEFEKNDALENNNENDLQQEKKMQLDILGNILKIPIQKTLKNKEELNKDSKFAKKQMIRYDPTEKDHKEYEIISENIESETKKIKKKKKIKGNVENNMNITHVEVSKEIYYSVSKSLTESLQNDGQFSVLKTFGNEETHDKEQQENKVKTLDSLKNKKFQFNFDVKNPFKYDSSDNENDNKEIDLKKEQSMEMPKKVNKFFFDPNDVRFNEAVTFFCKEFVPRDEFKNLRQELKQIVRLKIRRNVKNHQPFGYKKKIMKQNVGHKRKN